jgi:hypothetical protein
MKAEGNEKYLSLCGSATVENIYCVYSMLAKALDNPLPLSYYASTCSQIYTRFFNMIKPMKASDIKGKVDFGIITIREDEFQAVLKWFPQYGVAKGERSYSLSNLKTNSFDSNLIAITRCNEQGTGEAQNLARDLIFDLQPKCIVLVGIAGAIPSDDFTLGDVVIATRLHDFSVKAATQTSDDTYSVTDGPKQLPFLQHFKLAA